MDAHPTVDALLKERAFAVTRGDSTLVGLINEQLRLRGHVDPADKKPARGRKERVVKEAAPERAVES